MVKFSCKILILLCFAISSFGWSQKAEIVHESEVLKIKRIAHNSFVHISKLYVPEYGLVASNGLIYLNNQEAAVFDTPADSIAARELIRWITVEKKSKIVGVVINHFHDDCLKTLSIFHELNIPSFAYNKTILLANRAGKEAPQIGFADRMGLEVGRVKVLNRYFGEAHTSDNIVSYIPTDKVLFGGCMVKSSGSGKGNLNDANVDEWSLTIANIKASFPRIRVVVPGHGAHGGKELLTYTADLFEQKN